MLAELKPLVGVCWLMTTSCNLHCPMCYRYRAINQPVDFSTKLRVADELALLGVKKISFSGGEPLLEPHTFDLIGYVHKKHMKTALFTNGLLLFPDDLRKLDGILEEITLPIDGSTPQVHSRSRGVEESFYVSLELLRLCHSLTVRADVSTVVSRQNITDICNIGALLVQNGVTKWKVFQFAPIAKARRMDSKFSISAETFRHVIKDLNVFRDRIAIDVRGADTDTMQSYLHVTPSGDMLIVREMSYHNIGNILNCDNIFDALSEEKFNYLIHGCRHRNDIRETSSGTAAFASDGYASI